MQLIRDLRTHKHDGIVSLPNEDGTRDVVRMRFPEPGMILHHTGKELSARNRVLNALFDESGFAAADTQRKKKSRRVVTSVVEFTAAAHEYVEPAFDTSNTPGAAALGLGPFNMPAQGYLRHALILTTSSGGVAGPGVAHEDFPFRAYSEEALYDVNGDAIFGTLDGYGAFLTNLYGGYVFNSDPRSQPDYSATVVAPAWAHRLPIEIEQNNGLGAIPNQNSTGAYRVNLTLRASTDIWTTAPTTAPALRTRGYLEAWTQPNPQDPLGRPQAVFPPRVGSTQYWSRTIRTDLVAGEMQFPVTRMGNLIRMIILIIRDASTPAVRTTSRFPDPVTFKWDGKDLLREPRYLRRQYMGERYNTASAGHPAGVFVYDFEHDDLGKAGNGTPELWLPTVQGSRMEFTGTVGGTGSLEILVNDVKPVEVTQEERYAERSDTGFTPANLAAGV